MRPCKGKCFTARIIGAPTVVESLQWESKREQPTPRAREGERENGRKRDCENVILGASTSFGCSVGANQGRRGYKLSLATTNRAVFAAVQVCESPRTGNGVRAAYFQGANAVTRDEHESG